MGKRRRKRPSPRAEPAQKRSLVWSVSGKEFDSLTCQGYTSLAQNPEVLTGVDTIARLVGAMTIHLMHNTDGGDVRVVNELSRRVDIAPNQNMTRSNFIRWIVRTLLLDGNGNAVVYPRTENGFIRELVPIPAAYVSYVPYADFGYRVVIAGREYDPQDVLHFVLNPGSYYPWLGEGIKVPLHDVAHNLHQAAETEKGFMESKWKPSLIVKVDGINEEMKTWEGRQAILQSYVESGQAGEPWLLPAEQFDVQEVRPLTLSDLALADFVELDKKTVATLLGVPPFVLGVGEFKRDAWNSFVSTTIMPLAQNIQQELTRKLLYSPDYYFRFNSRSLMNYDLSDLASVGDEQYVRGIMTGNEVRDWLGLQPLEGLDQLVILENYIPAGMIGDQKKLVQNGGDGVGAENDFSQV